MGCTAHRYIGSVGSIARVTEWTASTLVPWHPQDEPNPLCHGLPSCIPHAYTPELHSSSWKHVPLWANLLLLLSSHFIRFCFLPGGGCSTGILVLGSSKDVLLRVSFMRLAASSAALIRPGVAGMGRYPLDAALGLALPLPFPAALALTSPTRLVAGKGQGPGVLSAWLSPSVSSERRSDRLRWFCKASTRAASRSSGLTLMCCS